MIAERRAQRPDDRGDLLSMLLLARDDEDDGGRMTDAQVRDEAMTIFLAGHETTANALTWTWHLLAQHPDVEARLHAGNRPRAARAACRRPPDVPRLPYIAHGRHRVDAAVSAGLGDRPPRDRRRTRSAGYTMPAGIVVLF